MAETRVVTVTDVEERMSQQGKRYWRIKVAGERQSLFCWDHDLVQALIPGATYQVTVNGSAEYPRITDVTLIDTGASADHVAPAPVAFTNERERRMLRMSALRAAADVLHGSAVPASELVAYADQLLTWLEHG